MNKIKMRHATLISMMLLLAAMFSLDGSSQTTSYPRMVVVEEFTGSWCGWCPRGTVGLERLQQDFGDRVILIAVHTGDGEPMVLPAYPNLVPGTGGVPSARIDRGDKVDPYVGTLTEAHYGINLDVEAALRQPSEAKVELSAQWADAQQWDVSFTVSTTFAQSSETAPYALAFVLTEDSLRGQGKSWAQRNFYTNSEDYLDDDMKFWRESADYVTNVAFNHVAVATLGITKGVSGSIQAPIVAGEPQQFTRKVTTLNNKVIQDKSRLTAVVLLLNTETGRVVNAAKSAVLPFDTNSIAAPVAPAASDGHCYNLGGQRIPAPRGSKGLYIRQGRKIVRDER